jgi:indolepyruvate ferredoxin oxidoreductase, alpha subunit
MLVSGNEAIALAALDAQVAFGSGYPGTPSTEILEYFGELGGQARWAPNEKVAFEVGIGVAFAGARALVTMKHVGLNVAADPLFTAAYTGVDGALVVVSADDPGMASSQDEQDNRRYAVAAGVPMLEPSDSQEAYDYTQAALEISQRWGIPVLLRVTTRICHSKTIVHERRRLDAPAIGFRRDIKGRVMIPAHARPAHRRLRAKLAEIAAWNEGSPLNHVEPGSPKLGIIASGVAYMHAHEAAPEASFLKLGMTYPLPVEKVRAFAAGVSRCVVIEEGDPYLVEQLRTAGIRVEGKSEIFRFGELDVKRVRRILASDTTDEPPLPPGKPPSLCTACPYRPVFETLRKHDCIVSGDIGCYTLGALPPLEAMDSQLVMGASIGIGLGLRHALPPEQARRVVSVIGDSTFVHSGITGLVEMVYNPPPTGHVLLILDNGTTAMTGRQEHPGTGRTLSHDPTGRLVYEDLAHSVGIRRVTVIDPVADSAGFERLLLDSLVSNELAVIIARRPCLLAAGKIKEYERAQESVIRK